MPPQPGIFALPYGTTHSQGGALASTSSQGHLHHNFHQHRGPVAGPSSSRAHVTGSMDDGLFKLRLLPLSLERSALLAQFEAEERYAIECAQIAYDEERERVEEEWKKGRQRVRERLLEGIEERRRRAREEKDGEGTVGGWFLYLFHNCFYPFTKSLSSARRITRLSF